MLDILKDYQALIAGLLGFGAVVWSIQSAKSNIIDRIKHDNDRDKEQTQRIKASAYEYYINASEKLVTRSSFSLEAVATYTNGLSRIDIPRPHFAAQFGKLRDALENRPVRPTLIDSDLASLYPLVDSATRRAISEYELIADTTDIRESVLLKEVDDILMSEGDIWGDNEHEAVKDALILLVNTHFGISIFAVDCYLSALNYFFNEFEYPDLDKSNQKCFFTLESSN